MTVEKLRVLYALNFTSVHQRWRSLVAIARRLHAVA